MMTPMTHVGSRAPWVTLWLLATLPGVVAQTSPTLTQNWYVRTMNIKETGITSLNTITCSDPDGLQTVASITITPQTNCNNCFVLEPVLVLFGLQTDSDINFYSSTATFNYAQVATYVIGITCSDGVDADVTGTFEVRLIPNSYPVFTNGLYEAVTIANAKTVTTGTTVHTVAATDSDAITNGNIYYTLTSVTPTGALFDIGYTTGVITTTGALNTQCTSTVTLVVQIADEDDTNPDTATIELTLGNYNQAPTISNLDATGYIAEDTAAGSDLLTMAIVDDATAEVGLTYTVTPAAAASLYTIQGTPNFKIQLASALDYEDSSLRNSEVVIVADDGNCAASTYTYTMEVQDVNEAPVISLTDHTFIVYEGTITADPGWTTTDPDAGDTLTYSITTLTPATAPLQIDANTGVITTTSDYDVDGGAMATAVTVTVQVADAAGLTSSTNVYLNILDSNDNAPVFDAASTHLYLTSSTCGATGNVGTLVATDADSAYNDNNVISYYLTASSTYFSIGQGTGDVVLNTVPATLGAYTVYVDAIDSGTYPSNLTAAVAATVTLTVTACTTTTVSSLTYTGFSVKDNVWWIVLSGLFFLVFAALLSWLVLTRILPFCRAPPPGHWRIGNFSCCKREPKPLKVKPLKPLKFKEAVVKAAPPSNKPKPGNDGFWKVVNDVMNRPREDHGPDRWVSAVSAVNAQKNAPPPLPPNDPLTNPNYQDSFF